MSLDELMNNVPGETKLERDAERAKIAAGELIQAFVWAESDEGHSFWNDVYEKLLDITLTEGNT